MSSEKRNHLENLVEASKPKSKKGKLAVHHDVIVEEIKKHATDSSIATDSGIATSTAPTRTRKHKKRPNKRG